MITRYSRRRFVFDVLKHVRLPLVATKLLEGYVNNCTDLSLKVQYSTVHYSTVQWRCGGEFCVESWSNSEGFVAVDSSSNYPNVLVVSCCDQVHCLQMVTNNTNLRLSCYQLANNKLFYQLVTILLQSYNHLATNELAENLLPATIFEVLAVMLSLPTPSWPCPACGRT